MSKCSIGIGTKYVRTTKHEQTYTNLNKSYTCRFHSTGHKQQKAIQLKKKNNEQNTEFKFAQMKRKKRQSQNITHKFIFTRSCNHEPT